MKPYKYGLFFKQRFSPLFICLVLGAFNDNLLRSGLVVMIAYAGVHGIKLPIGNEEILVTICSALLVVPFILFSFLAGQMADKYEKARLVTYIKIAEIGIMAGAFYGFATTNIYLLMLMLFISGTHSTFFGPIKYSILPEHMGRTELLAANGFVSGGTYLAILMGLIAGGLLVAMEGNVIGYTAMGVAVVGLIASLCIPRGTPADPGVKINWHLIHGTIEIVEHAVRNRSAFHAILGLSWFLLVGSVFMAQFANYASRVVHGDNAVYTLFLALFSIGIAAGSLICDKILKGEVTAKFAPWALLGVSLFTYIMVWATPHPVTEGLIGWSEFIRDVRHWPLLGSMMMVALCGGIYMVPLYALLQTESESGTRSRVIAASNLFDSLFMTVTAIVCAILLAVGVPITGLFLVLATANLVMFFYAAKAAKGHADRSA